MKTKVWKVTVLGLVILLWATLVAAAGLSLWRDHGCVIDTGAECTQVTESK